jgi:REP element-mobilizing transposase RayT
MSIPIRHADPQNLTAATRTFFVTSSIAGKRSMLQSDRSAGLFIRVLYEYRAQKKFRLHEFVVMPDHFHVLLSVDSSMTSNVPRNSSKVDSHSVQERNLDFVRLCGRKDFRRYASQTRRFLKESEITFITIP